MNPCYVTTSFAPEQFNSGISNAAFLIIKWMYEKKGIRSKVYAPVQQWGKTHQETEMVSIKRFATTKVGLYEFSPTLKGLICETNHDFIHSIHYGFLPASAGFSAAREQKKPHFFTTAFHPPASALKKELMGIYSRFKGSKILAGSRAVFPFNKNERNQLMQYSKGNYRIVPCPVNNDVFHPRKSKFTKLTVTYIGTFLPWKGPQIALDIFNKIRSERSDVNFFMIGTGPLADYLKQNANKNTKILVGPTSNKVSEILAKSDVVVCPTEYESFGSSIAESLMCGTPVVSTHVGAVPETVGPGGILVDYGDWIGMKTSIYNLLEDDKLRNTMAKRGIKHAKQYKYANVAKEIYRHYKDAINSF